MMRIARAVPATSLGKWLFVCCALALVCGPAMGQLNVLTVDCNPFAIAFDNTMGTALQLVDTGGLFNVTEVTPAAFRAMTAAQLAAFDLIAINNHPSRIDCGSGLGLGTTWHSVVGVNQCGGRVVLTSHDAPRFHMNFTFSSPMTFLGLCVGCEPLGAPDLVRDVAVWAGGGPGTGLVIFNDAAPFVGGSGWGNATLNLPAAWGISDTGNQFFFFADGGYTDILTPFQSHPIYAAVSDQRFVPNSISSFAANIGDGSFHTLIAGFNPAIFTPTEVVVNAGVSDPGGSGCCSFEPATGPDGTAITVIRDCVTDGDGDGVPDPLDVCSGTTIPESVPTVGLGVNRWALVDGDLSFDTTAPRGGGRGPDLSFTLSDTAGCSCEQIIDAQGLGKGHEKFGCSISAMEDWVALVN